MTIGNMGRCGFGLAVLVAACLLACPAGSTEPPKTETAGRLTAIDFDECEPIQIRARIMEVRPEKGTIIVAEREIKSLDVEVGGRLIRTAFSNKEGKPEPKSAFRAGQYVMVKGLLHSDGYVAAFEVQKIEKPRGKMPAYKPVSSQIKPYRKAKR